jgi:hypothetical protein
MMRGCGAVLAALVTASAVAAQENVTVDLVLDPEAEAALQSRGEWIIVNAWYYGDPALDAVPMDEMGLVYLGEEEATIYPVSQRIVLGGMTDGAPREWVIDPILNVNVFTARMTDQNNLLDCGFVEGPVTELAGAAQTISCRMLGQ